MKESVSVVVPLFNAATWIEGSLATIVAQTYPSGSLEVIVVDDGSTDEGAARAEAFLRRHGLRYQILHQSNGGPSSARNRGWRHAQGEWIQFLDADDALAPQKIQLQMAIARQADPNVAGVYSDWSRVLYSVDNRIVSSNRLTPRLDTEPLLDLLQAEKFIHTGAQLCRRAWLERVGGFCEEYRLIEDVDLWLRWIMAGAQFQHVSAEAPLFFYHQRNIPSLSRRDPRAFANGCIRNIRMLESYWLERNELTPARARALARVYFEPARNLAQLDWPAFLELTEHITALDPGFIPPGPARLRRTATLIGYVKAEQLARTFRRGKSVLNGVIRRLPFRNAVPATNQEVTL